MKDNLHKLVKKDCFLHKKKLQIQYSLVRSFKDKDEKYKLEFKNMTDKMNEMKSEIVALRRKIEERDLELSTKNSTLQSYEEQLRSIPHLQIDLFNATQNLRKQTLTINQMKLQEDEHKQNFQGLIQTVHKLNSYIESLKLDIAEREAKLIEKEGLQLAYTEKLKTIAALEAYIRGMQNDKEVSTAADTMEVDEYHSAQQLGGLPAGHILGILKRTGDMPGLMNMMPKVKRHVRFNLNQSEVDEKGTQLNGHILAPHQ